MSINRLIIKDVIIHRMEYYSALTRNESAHCQRLMPAILATWEAEIRRIKAQNHPGQIVIEIPSPKITSAKWTGGVAQETEHLFFPKALSSNPRPTKERKKKKKKGGARFGCKYQVCRRLRLGGSQLKASQPVSKIPSQPIS
jgi:hypothetical protein